MIRFLSHITLSFWLIILLIFSSCRDDIAFSDGPIIPDGKVKLELFTRSYGYDLPTTRAGSAKEDDVEKEPWVLVFKEVGSDFIFVEATQAASTTDSKTYIMLTQQTVKCKLLIIANPQDYFYSGGNTDAEKYEYSAKNLNEKFEGESISTVCAMLLSEPLNEEENSIPFVDKNIPMSTILDINNGINSNSTQNEIGATQTVKRAVAKLIIKSTAANFDFKGISTVVNAPRQGQLHYLSGTLMNNDGNLSEYRPNGTYDTNLVDAIGQSTENDPIYLYESSKANSTYIIIRASYYDNEFYYKVMVEDDNQSPMDILRNHQYTITITSVSGIGYDSVEDAKVGKASNIKLDFKIEVVDDSSYQVIANNDYYLGISNSEFIAYTTGGSKNGEEKEYTFDAFTLTTDCDIDFDKKTISEKDLNYSFWILDDYRKIPIASGNTPIIFHNVKVQIRNWLSLGYVNIELGNLSSTVSIRRENAISASGNDPFRIPDPWGGFYHCVSGYIVEDEAKSWIKLMPSTDVVRNDSANIVVQDGIIKTRILKNKGTTKRYGTIYLNAIRNPGYDPTNGGYVSSFRIKVLITQLAP